MMKLEVEHSWQMSTHILVLSAALSIWKKCEIRSSWLHRAQVGHVQRLEAIAKKNEENSEKLVKFAPNGTRQAGKNQWGC